MIDDDDIFLNSFQKVNLQLGEGIEMNNYNVMNARCYSLSFVVSPESVFVLTCRGALQYISKVKEPKERSRKRLRAGAHSKNDERVASLGSSALPLATAATHDRVPFIPGESYICIYVVVSKKYSKQTKAKQKKGEINMYIRT